MPDNEPRRAQGPPLQKSKRATVALIFGILGVAGFGILAPLAWWLGRRELKAIDAGIKSPTHRGRAQSARTLGIFGSALMVVTMILFITFAAFYEPPRDADGAVIRTGTFFVEDLRVGDCGDWPQGDTILSVTLHPCNQPHDFELYALVNHPDGPRHPYPGERSVLAWSEQTCYEEFEPYVGVAFDDSPALTYSYLYPLEASWRGGDRTIQCVLIPTTEGDQLIGSMRGSVLGTSGQA